MYKGKKIVVFLGPPGSGKGTQASLLEKKFNYDIISIGDILRKNINENTELGIKAKEFVKNGKLVPDDLIVKIVENYLKININKAEVHIFDGFPRNISQAESLEKILENENGYIDFVIRFNLDEKIIIKRTSNRRICNKCKKVYNILSNPPINDNKCDKCSVELIIRDDDKSEVIMERLRVYNKKTKPLIAFYNIKNNYYCIEADNKIENILQQIGKIING